MFFLIKKGYELYFDIKYIINFIDKKFLLKISLKIVIKKMFFLIIIRELNINTYNISEYIKLYIYLFDKNDIILIKREFHIVENFTIKALIDINIIKLKRIILNMRKNIIIIDFYQNIEIFITFFI